MKFCTSLVLSSFALVSLHSQVFYLLDNGDFEQPLVNGNVPGSFSGITLETAQPIHGSQSAVGRTISFTLPTTPGQDYDLSFWVRATGHNYTLGHSTIHETAVTWSIPSVPNITRTSPLPPGESIFNINQGGIYTGAASELLPDQQVTLHWTATVAQTDVSLNSFFGQTEASGWWDDIAFSAPVPEPSTYAAITGFGLLGFAGFRTARTRRRNSKNPSAASTKKAAPPLAEWMPQ